MQKILTLVSTVVLSNFIHAQFLNSKPDSLYYDYKNEVLIGGGFAKFSRNLSGLEFGEIDSRYSWFNKSRTNLLFNLGFRRHIKPLFATTTQVNYYRYNQDETLFYHKGRGDILEANLIDFSQKLEFIFFSKYNTTFKDEKLKYKRLDLYAFTGLGAVYFDSKTNSNSEYIYRGFGSKFNNISLFIPSGLGFQKSISKSLSLRFELTYSLPLSDYNFKIKEENCAYLSAINNTSDVEFCNLEFEKQLDYYVSANFSLVKLLKTKDKKFKENNSEKK